MAEESEIVCPSCGRPQAAEGQVCECGYGGPAPATIESFTVRTRFESYIQPPGAELSEGRTGREGLAIAGMVCGIVGLAAICIWTLSLPCSVVGLVLSIIGLKSKNRGMAIGGIVCATIALAAVSIVVIAAVVFMHRIDQLMGPIK